MGPPDMRPAPPPPPPRPSHTAPVAGISEKNQPPPPINTSVPPTGPPPAYTASPAGLEPDTKTGYSATPAKTNSATGNNNASLDNKMATMMAEQNAAIGLAPPTHHSRPGSPGTGTDAKTPPSGRSSPGAGPSSASPSSASASTPSSKKRPLLNRLLLAGEVVLTSLESTANTLIESGTSAASRTAGHRWGSEAGQAAHLLGGSVRNVAVVYIDARGIGRKALLKGTAKGFVKARLKNGETIELQSDASGRVEGVEVRNGEVERKDEGTVVVGMQSVGATRSAQGQGQGQAGRGAISAPPSAGGWGSKG